MSLSPQKFATVITASDTCKLLLLLLLVRQQSAVNQNRAACVC
jgi:hypothetical protein